MKYKIIIAVNPSAKTGRCITIRTSLADSDIDTQVAYASGDQTPEQIVSLVANEALAFIAGHPYPEVV